MTRKQRASLQRERRKRDEDASQGSCKGRTELWRSVGVLGVLQGRQWCSAMLSYDVVGEQALHLPTKQALKNRCSRRARPTALAANR